MKRFLTAFLSLLPGALFIASLASAGDLAATPTHMELGEYLWARQDPGARKDLDLYTALQRRVRSDFDEICGDVWCEGDIQNWQLLTMECSIRSDGARVRECHLVVAGSEQSLSAETGRFTVLRREVLECRVELNIPLEKLLKVKGLDSEIRLPRGATTSFYQELVRCMP
jgi:hypothetical protein